MDVLNLVKDTAASCESLDAGEGLGNKGAAAGAEQGAGQGLHVSEEGRGGGAGRVEGEGAGARHPHGPPHEPPHGLGGVGVDEDAGEMEADM